MPIALDQFIPCVSYRWKAGISKFIVQFFKILDNDRKRFEI